MGKHRDLMDQWFQCVWNDCDPSFIHKACDIDMTTTGHLGRPLLGPDDFEAFHDVIRGLVENIGINILHSVEDESWISLVYEFKGNKTGTDIPVEMTGSSMLKIINGKITEVYEHVNYIDFFQGLGIMPPNTLNHCLSGKALSE